MPTKTTPQINTDERPENYRVDLRWKDSTLKGDNPGGDIECDPYSALSVWKALNFINEHNRSIGQGLPYTEIECELSMDTGEGEISLEQLEALVRIMDLQSQREEIYDSRNSRTKPGEEDLERQLDAEQRKLLKQHFDAEWPEHDEDNEG